MILYEYPFNERIRSLLRLEYLFDRLFFFAQAGDARMHQAAVSAMFDLLDACERTDLKGAILQELERQRATLAALRDHPEVAQQALQATLAEIERAAAALAAQGKIGQNLRENEWLVSLRGRLAVPGGATQVDMPSYFAWQSKPESVRQADLQRWIAPLRPLSEALNIVLQLLREGGRRIECVAPQGAYQEMLAGRVHQLLRVWVDGSQGLFPEISANKYMIWIRFSIQDGELKPQQVGRDVPFTMALCSS
ncbi:cell division protein ZapD [Orrella sp. JC864]|uniref:cell division protein ZapD n=1 Tax=Orrella sp. JC864 TaxID=3120298 RepID=UPI00142AD0C6